MLDSAVVHCEGVQRGAGPERYGHGFCKIVDDDGDMIIGDIPYSGFSYDVKLVEGTGKWKGIKGTLHSERFVLSKPGKGAMPGTYQGCRREKGSMSNFAVEQTGSVLHGTRTPRPDAGRVPITYRILNKGSGVQLCAATRCISSPSKVWSELKAQSHNRAGARLPTLVRPGAETEKSAHHSRTTSRCPRSPSPSRRTAPPRRQRPNTGVTFALHPLLAPTQPTRVAVHVSAWNLATRSARSVMITSTP
jgi:hypothetical protein